MGFSMPNLKSPAIHVKKINHLGVYSNECSFSQHRMADTILHLRRAKQKLSAFYLLSAISKNVHGEGLTMFNESTFFEGKSRK